MNERATEHFTSEQAGVLQAFSRALAREVTCAQGAPRPALAAALQPPAVGGGVRFRRSSRPSSTEGVHTELPRGCEPGSAYESRRRLSASSPGTRKRSLTAPSPPTGGRSSRRAQTRPSSSGMPRPVPSSHPGWAQGRSQRLRLLPRRAGHRLRRRRRDKSVVWDAASGRNPH